MQTKLITVGKPASWVQEAINIYIKRLSIFCRFQLTEIETSKRSKHTNISQMIVQEGEKILSALSPRDHVVALDMQGTQWSTTELSKQFNHWQLLGKPIVFLIGGPDGLSGACKKRASQMWGLSKLTLPHQFVRILVVEQLYRAASMLAGHPYHR